MGSTQSEGCLYLSKTPYPQSINHIIIERMTGNRQSPTVLATSVKDHNPNT